MRPSRFFINPTDLSDGSRIYSIDDEDGMRIASTMEEAAARDLRDSLNSKGAVHAANNIIKEWVAVHPADRIFNGFIYQ